MFQVAKRSHLVGQHQAGVLSVGTHFALKIILTWNPVILLLWIKVKVVHHGRSLFQFNIITVTFIGVYARPTRSVQIGRFVTSALNLCHLLVKYNSAQVTTAVVVAYPTASV